MGSPHYRECRIGIPQQTQEGLATAEIKQTHSGATAPMAMCLFWERFRLIQFLRRRAVLPSRAAVLEQLLDPASRTFPGVVAEQRKDRSLQEPAPGHAAHVRTLAVGTQQAAGRGGRFVLTLGFDRWIVEYPCGHRSPIRTVAPPTPGPERAADRYQGEQCRITDLAGVDKRP